MYTNRKAILFVLFVVMLFTAACGDNGPVAVNPTTTATKTSCTLANCPDSTTVTTASDKATCKINASAIGASEADSKGLTGKDKKQYVRDYVSSVCGQ